MKQKTMTLSIPEKVYMEMKEYSEIKWSEVARESIISYLEKMKTVTTTDELRERISPKILKTLIAISSKEARAFSKKVNKLDWNRTNVH